MYLPSRPTRLLVIRSSWILVVFNSADWPTQDKIPDPSESLFIYLVVGFFLPMER
jgi:hypothetical protein